jgi:uncharacterized RDD family membrane protein YckC
VKTCLVLMPFGEDLKKRFEFIQACGKAADLEVRRVDTYAYSGNILTAIARAISQADLVIADLSKANANVAYELAIAQCMGKRLVLITNDRSAVPFDLLAYRMELVNEESPNEAEGVTRAIRQALVATYVTGPLGGSVVFGQRVFLRRTMALLFDAIVLIAICILPLLVAFGQTPSTGAGDKSAFVWAFALFIALLYFTFLTWRWSATLGQRLLDLKVVTFDGEKLSFPRSLGRAVASLLSVFTYGIGFLWCLRGPGYRTFHDIASSTMVIRAKGKPNLAPV